MKYTLDQLIAFSKSLPEITDILLNEANEIESEVSVELKSDNLNHEQWKTAIANHPRRVEAFNRYVKSLHTHKKIKVKIAELAYKLIDEIDTNLN